MVKKRKGKRKRNDGKKCFNSWFTRKLGGHKKCKILILPFSLPLHVSLSIYLFHSLYPLFSLSLSHYISKSLTLSLSVSQIFNIFYFSISLFFSQSITPFPSVSLFLSFTLSLSLSFLSLLMQQNSLNVSEKVGHFARGVVRPSSFLIHFFTFLPSFILALTRMQTTIKAKTNEY